MTGRDHGHRLRRSAGRALVRAVLRLRRTSRPHSGYLDANATPRFPITADETVQRIRAAVEQFNGGDAG